MSEIGSAVVWKPEGIGANVRELANDADCLDPCHEPVGDWEGGRCPAGNHCACLGQRQCSNSGYCFGEPGTCVEEQRSFVQDSAGDTIAPVSTGYSCCESTMKGSVQGAEQAAASLERCLLKCDAAKWCVAAEWRPEALACFLILRPDSYVDALNLMGAPENPGRQFCMRRVWNVLTVGGETAATEDAQEGGEPEHELSNVSICGVNMSLATEESGQAGGIDVYGRAEDSCDGGMWICYKDNLMSCLPKEVASSFSAQHDWNCTEVQEKSTSTRPVVVVQPAEESAGFFSSPAWWIILVALSVCSTALAFFFWVRGRQRSRVRAHVSPISSKRRKISTESLPSRSQSRGSKSNIQHVSSDSSGHRGTSGTIRSPASRSQRAQSFHSGCGYVGVGVLKGGWRNEHTEVFWTVPSASPGPRGAAATNGMGPLKAQSARWNWFSFKASGLGDVTSEEQPPIRHAQSSPWGRGGADEDGMEQPTMSKSPSGYWRWLFRTDPDCDSPEEGPPIRRVRSSPGGYGPERERGGAHMYSEEQPGVRRWQSSAAGQRPARERADSRVEGVGAAAAETSSATSAGSSGSPSEPDVESFEEHPPVRSISSPDNFGRAGERTTTRTELPTIDDLRLDISSPASDSILEKKVDKVLQHLRSSTRRSQRNRVFLELCRAWHPDKNGGGERLATLAFQRLQASRAWFMS